MQRNPVGKMLLFGATEGEGDVIVDGGFVRAATVVVFLSNHAVENETIQIPDVITDDHIGLATVHLRRLLVGRSLGEVESVESTNDVHVDAVCFATLNALGRHRKDKPVFVDVYERGKRLPEADLPKLAGLPPGSRSIRP